MSSWMKTLQSGANKVGNEAAKLKHYAEISLLKGDIKSLKEAWGVTCFDLYSQGDANGVDGYSPFPGNTNAIFAALPMYVAVLTRTGGMVPEYVNPKYKKHQL